MNQRRFQSKLNEGVHRRTKEGMTHIYDKIGIVRGRRGCGWMSKEISGWKRL